MADPLDYFPNFLWKAWRTIGLPKPTPLQYDFCAYLDSGAHKLDASILGDRKILMAFRGASKSYVTTAFAVCVLRRDRTRNILVTSATDKFAGGIANFAYQMVNGFDWLADMKPGSDQRQSAQAFDVAGAPAAKDESFASIGIMGQITGRRASDIIGDDLETPNTSETEVKRAELRKRMSELSGAILKPGGNMYLLGTAQTEQTVYRDYAEEKGYELRIYPIVYPTPSEDPKLDEVAKYGPRLAPFVADALKANPELAGTSVEPSRFNELDIHQRQLEWGKTEFDRQFKMFLDAGVGKGNPLRMRDLVVMDIPRIGEHDKGLKLPSEIIFNPLPSNKWADLQLDALTGDSAVFAPAKVDIWVDAEQTVMVIDPSGEGSDETSWTIGAGLHGRVFLLEQQAALEGFSAETMKRIAADAKRWRVTTVKIEKNFGGGMFGELLQPHLMDIEWPCEIIEEVAGRQQKEKRIIAALEPMMTDHRLVINRSVLEQDFHVDYPDVEAAKRRYYRLTYQLSRMTAQKGCVVHDDRADGLAGLAQHFIGMLMRQLEKSKEEGKLKSIDKEVESLIEARKKAGLPLFGLDKNISQLGRPSPRKR